MLCSNCSQIIRPVVALDIDGTIGDYHGHFIRFAEQYVGRRLRDDYTGSTGFKEWFWEVNQVEPPEFRAIKLAYRQGGMKRSMPIIDGAIELVSEIRSHDAELWVTTTRPYLSLDNIVPDTVEWLRRHKIEYDGGMLFDEDKYAQLVTRVNPDRIVVVIDDLPEMCDDADYAVGRPVGILIANPYNVASIPRTHNIWDITAGIGGLIKKWREQHEGSSADT